MLHGTWYYNKEIKVENGVKVGTYKARLHDGGIGYRPVKYVVRSSHFACVNYIYHVLSKRLSEF